MGQATLRKVEESSQFRQSLEGYGRRPRTQSRHPVKGQLRQGPLSSADIQGTAAVLSTWLPCVAQRGMQSWVPPAPYPQGAGSSASEIGCTQREKWTQGELSLRRMEFGGAAFSGSEVSMQSEK